MGLFGKNWERELDRVAEFLARDLPVRALEIAERAERKAGPESRSRAAGLALQARQALLKSVLGKAEAAEQAGEFEDAADWLLAAIDNEPSAMRRGELEDRRRQLVARWEDSNSPLVTASAALTVVAGEAPAEEPLDRDFQYETLVSMLTDEVGPRYENRSPAFRQALVDLNEGRGQAALAALVELAEASGDDPVLRLELGRARTLTGDHEGAQNDFDAAWTELGDAPLDAHSDLMLPAMWAEAALATGREDAVRARLEPLATPAQGNPALCRLYAVALVAGGHRERAIEYLEEVAGFLPEEPELALLLAETTLAAGDPRRATEILERAVAPSCAGGSCARPAPHLASFRALAELHLGPGGNPDRARELMAIVASAQQGRLGPAELRILAGYYRITGDRAAASDATAAAESLEASAADPATAGRA